MNLAYAIAINRVEGVQAVIKSVTVENCTRVPFGDPKVGHPYGLCKKPVRILFYFFRKSIF